MLKIFKSIFMGVVNQNTYLIQEVDRETLVKQKRQRCVSFWTWFIYHGIFLFVVIRLGQNLWLKVIQPFRYEDLNLYLLLNNAHFLYARVLEVGWYLLQDLLHVLPILIITYLLINIWSWRRFR